MAALRAWVRRLPAVACRGSWWYAGAAAALLLAWWQPAPLQRLDLLAYDLLLPQRSASAQAPLIVAIDDESLARLAHWPWPRSVYADMVDALREAGAQAVGLDVLFTASDPSGERSLAQAMARQGKVVLAVAPRDQGEGRFVAAAAQAQAADALPPSWLGHVDVPIDMDGQSRRLYLHAGPQRQALPALALAMAAHLRPVEQAPADFGTGPVPPPATGWTRHDERLVPRGGNLPMVSFAAGLADPALLQQARGRAVFIGATAPALGTELATPIADGPRGALPAVLYHAQAFDALQAGALVQRVSSPLTTGFAVLLISALALRRLRPSRRPAAARVLIGSLLLCLPLLASAALLRQQLWLAPTLPAASLLVALVFREAAALRAVDGQLRRTRAQAQAALQAIDEAVLTVDLAHHTVRFANPSALAQAAPVPLLHQPLFANYPLEAASQEPLRRAIAQCATQGGTVKLRELLQLHTAHGLRSLRAAASALHGTDGRVDGAVLVFTDMTDALAAVREREHTATHDALTGLPNRVLLNERLLLTLSRVQRQHSVAALLFVDLDRFKHINDTLGHRAGDAMLCVLAQRLRAMCRDTDTVARWGGDEFVLILEDVGGPEGAAAAAAKIVAALTQDVALGAAFHHRQLPSSASAGVVLLPRDGTQIEELLSKADMAMYRAKGQPKASFHIWASDINARMHDRLALEVELRQALADERLQLHYQPQFALADGRLIGMQALLRWERRPGAMVQPADFVGLAEESGLIVDIGAWAVRTACRQLAQWLAAGLQPVPLAVNVSARQCMNGEIVQVVRQALRESAIAPSLLRLEITETAAMGEGEQTMELLQDIHALGVQLSLDDFGTGFSSLAHLKRFPLDELKIDRSFVAALPAARADAAIVHATVALARGLGLRVMAEGVETQAQAQFLADCGCDGAQGYLLARPEQAWAAAQRLPAV